MDNSDSGFEDRKLVLHDADRHLWIYVVLSVILGVIILLTMTLKSPDVISAPVMISLTPPPTEVVPNSSGPVEILVQNHQIVAKDQPLFYIKSDGDRKAIEAFDQVFSAIDNIYAEANYDRLSDMLDEDLGPVLQKTINYLNTVLEYSLFQQANYEQEINILTRKLQRTEEQIRNLKKIASLTDTNLTIEGEILSIDSALNLDSVIADNQLRLSLRNFNERKISLYTFQEDILEKEVQELSLKDQLTEKIDLNKEGESRHEFAVLKSYIELKKEIAAWRLRSYIFAPFEGNVEFLGFWENGEFFEVGRRLASIIPVRYEMTVLGELPSTGSGRVEVDQIARIKLDSHPYQEFGYLNGTIGSISSIQKDNVYLISIDLSDDLTSSSGHLLTIGTEATGTAEIIVERKSLFN
ncbi:MAG: HlyD family efflux transporter periplasmic adaptor subunit, partial [Bacteroidota bacterium]